ncbi:MAG: LysR family transcriptional regulator [Mycolicibacterium insubricum]|nr:LysR family transcriptional regulator [Mycobacterium sp.]
MGDMQPAAFTLRQIAYFTVAAETCSTTAAASHFVMTQSAMSAALTDLERALGTQLFVRHRGRGLELTATARSLLPEARRLLQGAEDFQGLATNLDDVLAGRLSIGCFDALSPALLPPLIAEISRLHAGLTVEPLSGKQGELAAAVTDGSIELALLFDVDLPRTVEAEFLYQPKPHALVSMDHPLASESTISIDDLAADRLISLNTPPAPRILREALRAAGFSLVPAYELENYDLIRALVHRNLGYSLFLQPLGAFPAHWSPTVRAIPLSDQLSTPAVVLVRARGARLTRRAKAFRDLCIGGFLQSAIA